MSSEIPSGPPLGKGGRAAVLATAVVCGAAVMEVEILGARVVSPWFGVSLFVWTALITVTLLSLAMGYYLGGRLADRSGSVHLLGILVGAAGLCLLLEPLIRGAVLKISVAAGVRGGALLSAAILFGPALTLLGMVTPFAVRLFLRDVREAGRTVGRLSALSTMGSFVGTIATGFWLIPAFHVDQIAGGTACVLLALSGLCFFTGTRKPYLLLLPVPALLFVHAPPLAAIVLPSGTKAEVVLRKGSFYGPISIVDYSYFPNHTREMLIGGIVQGGIDVNTGDSIYPFTYFLERAALKFNPGAKRALVLGLGPGVIPRRLAKYGLTGTAVEIDHQVVEIARNMFGFTDKDFPVVQADGRQFLESSNEKYDIVLLDIFAAESEPAHLLTKEAFKSAKDHLNPGGVMVINLPGMAPAPGEENLLLESVLATLETEFPEVATFFDSRASRGSVITFTTVARLSGSRKDEQSPSFLPIHPMAARFLEGFMESRYKPSGKGMIYTDDWCPVEAQGARIKLLWRKAEIETTPSEILLN